MKYFFWSIFAVFLIGVSVSLISIWQTVDSQRLVFCLTQDCINFAKQEFAGALWLLKLTTDFCVAVATVFAGYYALRTYMDSVYARRSIQRVDHYRSFCSLIDSAPIDVKYNFSSNSKKHLYGFIFSGAGLADFEVSKAYKKFLLELHEALELSSNNYGSGKFEKKQHADKIIQAVSRLGIQFPDYRDADYYQHEVRVCGFIDYINSTIPGVDLKVSDERHYRVAW